MNIRDINDVTTTAHLLEENTINKLNALQRSQVQTVVPGAGGVTLVSNYGDYQVQQIGVPVTPLPKYQQALQQQSNILQPAIPQNEITGKSQFPKHVFSQAKFVNKKVSPVMIGTPPVEQNRVNCDICQKSLKTKKMLWAHKVAVHFGGNFPCEICGKRCITGAELKRHLTSHSNERKFVCQYCGLAYKRWSHLYQHLKVHEEEKNYRCDVCHLNFKVQSELKDHCFAVHNTNEVMHCNVCKNKLQTPLAVYNHSMKHTGTRDFVCEICGSNFKRKQHLVTHMKTHFTESRAQGENESYSCQVCESAVFKLKMDLKAHCHAEHPMEHGEEYNCRTCDKKLSLPNSIYLHGLRHAGLREYICDKCNYAFKRKAHLHRHKMDVHPETIKKRKPRTKLAETMACHMCKKVFKYKASLISHLATRHGLVKASEIKHHKKRWRCKDCPAKFKAEAILQKHRLDVHSKIAKQEIIDEHEQNGEAMVTDVAGNEVMEAKLMEVVEVGDISMVHAANIKSENIQTQVADPNDLVISMEEQNETNPPDPTASSSADQETHTTILVNTSTGELVSSETTETGESQLTAEGASLQAGLAQISTEGGQITLTTLDQANTLGELVSAEAVSLANLPVGLDGRNLINFTDESGERIVVLLSTMAANQHIQSSM